MSFFALFCLACFTIGVTYISWAGYCLWRSEPKLEGRVRCIIKHEDDVGTWYTPVIEFEWRGEKIVLENLPKRRVRPDFEVGATFSLYFPSYAPRLARLEPVSMPLVAVSAFVSVLCLIMSISSL
jgi:hypothetical protein